jgi:hypothetical protein
VSGPPTPFGDVTHLVHDPEMNRLLTDDEKRPRAELIRLADGYFDTLARNDGTLHTTFFAVEDRESRQRIYNEIVVHLQARQIAHGIHCRT